MLLPKSAEDLVNFVRELIDECLISREARRARSRVWRHLFYTGSVGAAPSKYNRCYSHVDKLSSYLFSPADVKFTVEFDGSSDDAWKDKAQLATRRLNRDFNKRGCGVTFAEGNEISLVEGCAIGKMVWGPKGLEPWIIRPSFFGVLREDIADIQRQEAMVHSYYVTPAVFRRMIWSHPDKADLMTKVRGSSAARADEEIDDSYFHEIVTGGIGPMAVAGTMTAGATQQYGTVGITSAPGPQLAPTVAADLIRVDDLWVWDDDREDWTTIRYVEPGLIIEGKYKRRNLSDVPGEHPFVKICSNEVPGYFWGRSELATVFENQMLLNKRMNEIDTIFGLRTRPPRAFSGFQSVTEEKARALLSPGGMITEQAIGSKVDNLAPEMPPEALAYLEKLEDIFDDVGGFTNILSGEGEPGVRAGVHAGVLLRTSTPRLRDRSLLVERQCAQFGELALRMVQVKDPTVLTTKTGDKFTMAQLPPDASVSVDSHTSSPAFSEDNKQLAFAYAKAGVIDEETLIEMTHPPREDELIDRLRARREKEAQFAKDNPAIAAEMAKSNKK